MPKFGEFWESCRNASNSVLTDAVSRVITESLGLWVVDAGGRMELDILMVIAEIAVALAGFAAVVANFSENWTKAKSKQLTNLLTQSGIALFASMVPLIMSQMRADDSAGIDTVWMVSSASYVFFASSYLAVSLFLSRSRSFERGLWIASFFLRLSWRSAHKSTISIWVPRGGFTCWRSCSV